MNIQDLKHAFNNLSKIPLFEIETSEFRFAIVFDGMWNNVKDVFSDDRFKKVIIMSVFFLINSYIVLLLKYFTLLKIVKLLK